MGKTSQPYRDGQGVKSLSYTDRSHKAMGMEKKPATIRDKHKTARVPTNKDPIWSGNERNPLKLTSKSSSELAVPISPAKMPN